MTRTQSARGSRAWDDFSNDHSHNDFSLGFCWHILLLCAHSAGQSSSAQHGLIWPRVLVLQPAGACLLAGLRLFVHPHACVPAVVAIAIDTAVFSLHLQTDTTHWHAQTWPTCLPLSPRCAGLRARRWVRCAPTLVQTCRCAAGLRCCLLCWRP